MRKFSSILLCTVFILGQYARQLTYLECTVSNTFKAAANQCDCEKKAGFENSGGDPSAVPKAHLHIHTEDLIACHFAIDLSPADHILQSILNARDDKDVSEGQTPAPWQPPNAGL